MKNANTVNRAALHRLVHSRMCKELEQLLPETVSHWEKEEGLDSLASQARKYELVCWGSEEAQLFEELSKRIERLQYEMAMEALRWP